jgi:Family of unknown function (DUF5677)
MKGPLSDVVKILAAHQSEIKAKGVCSLARDGLYRAILKASFVRICEYVEFAHTSKPQDKAEGFFAAASLRQCCEDLIALKFLAQLRRKDRDDVVQALMLISTNNAAEKQIAFFRRKHPYQPVLLPPWKKDIIYQVKDRLTEIGKRTQLWNTERKLPPIEQMAMRVGLTALYEFLYAATSEIVHFNVRIALRSGWGDVKKSEFHFSSSNFAPYYISFTQSYSCFLLIQFCRTFRAALRLSPSFMLAIDEIELSLERQFRWPEIVTFEEMNVKREDNIIVSAFLAMKQDERTQKLRKKYAHKKKALSSRGIHA